MSRSRGSIHTPQQLKQSRTMPGITLEGTAKLFGDQSGFGV
jgi:hypothetical protein